MNEHLERFAHALVLFALGVALLGHGMAATVFVEGVTPTTVALPLVGSVVAYRSLVGLLPPESSLSADGFLGLLTVLTTAFVNLVVPAAYRTTDVLPVVTAPPSYWPAFVVGVAGFAVMGVYELLADRIRTASELTTLLGAGVVATVVGVLLLVAPARPVASVTPIDATAGLAGAVLAAALYDYGTVQNAELVPGDPQ